MLFNDFGSWLDFIAPVADEWIGRYIVEALLTGQN